jgi:hypothetical protein
MHDTDITSLLDELSSFDIPAPHTQRAATDESPLEEKDLQQYVLNKTKALVEVGLGAIQDLTPGIVAGSDAKEIEALSKLMASTAQSIDALQRSALIDKKADRDEKLEKMRIEAKKEMIALQGPQQNVTNNNVLIASREEIIAALTKQKEETLKIENF